MSNWAPTRSGLLVPEGERRRYLLCELCRKPFPLNQRQQFERHVKACLKRNGDSLEAHVARREADHGDQDFDQEFYKYLREGGR